MLDEVLPMLPLAPAELGEVTNTPLGAQQEQCGCPGSGAHFHDLPAKPLHVQSCLLSTVTANHFPQLKRERERALSTVTQK